MCNAEQIKLNRLLSGTEPSKVPYKLSQLRSIRLWIWLSDEMQAFYTFYTNHSWKHTLFESTLSEKICNCNLISCVCHLFGNNRRCRSYVLTFHFVCQEGLSWRLNTRHGLQACLTFWSGPGDLGAGKPVYTNASSSVRICSGTAMLLN